MKGRLMHILHRWWENGWNCFCFVSQIKSQQDSSIFFSLVLFQSPSSVLSSSWQFSIFLYLFWLQDGQEMIGRPLQDCVRFWCWQCLQATWMKCPAIDLYRDLLHVHFSCWDRIYSLHKSLRYFQLPFISRWDWSMVFEDGVWECVGKGKAKGHLCCVYFVLFLIWFLLDLLRNLYLFIFPLSFLAFSFLVTQ